MLQIGFTKYFSMQKVLESLNSPKLTHFMLDLSIFAQFFLIFFFFFNFSFILIKIHFDRIAIYNIFGKMIANQNSFVSITVKFVYETKPVNDQTWTVSIPITPLKKKKKKCKQTAVKITEISWNQRLLKKLLKSWFHGKFWAWSSTFPHCAT